MSMRTLLLLAAFLCFLLAAGGVGGKVNLIGLGLAFWILTQIGG